MKTAEIVSVGTELLMGQIVDTNAQFMGQLFPELGIRHVFRQTVGDNLERLTGALKLALSRSDLVITIGGLGPTQDDLTREGIAAALNDPLVHDPEMEATIRHQFEVRKLRWTGAQVRQAMRPACGRPIPNPNGTAEGLICEKDGKVVIAMPGPSGEFRPMANGPVKEFLKGFGSDQVIHSKLLKICGMGESLVEERIRDLIDGANPSVAPYAKVGEIHLRITAAAESIAEAEKLIHPVAEAIRSRLGIAVFGEGDETLEQSTLNMLEHHKQMVAVAESITGGWLGQRLTTVAGSGNTFKGGVICYAIETKIRELAVDKSLLEDPEIGPVSPEVARQMAEGVRKSFKSDYGVSLTGNAGPTSDEGGKPVGLVYIGVASPNRTRVEEYNFRGIREDIRYRSTQFALTLLREEILNSG